ncbi:2-dehydro-3-deoxygalactonokinase [Xinfangfangia sp. CPCC 101601]|uniref:2-dehydro-3-deoxygalactonokinase n=1 Tax=Pseudogemmobacter lacusdianii TaxID=3069608 RepID=A0ABU0VY66_9RHOB|nr:2-dehydro-3-deoxygalactonokinase [Xinfangfangia sp. CPCC 101601]MDQ2066463.1 2-dehydro-3-deoxygalactonokinase [Xinfangfangia sp. CPCC 101601]
MGKAESPARWIAAELNGSALTLQVIGLQGEVLGEASERHVVSSASLEAALLRLAESWLGTATVPVLLAGAPGQWWEQELRAVPCTPLPASGLARLTASDPRLAIYPVPGLRQARPVDLMQGDETRIAGALALWPQFDGVICLPGAETRWAHVSAGEVVSFQTSISGALMGWVTGDPAYRGSFARHAEGDGFEIAVSETLSRPERVAARLYSLHAEAVLGAPSAAAGARLKGYILGMELAGARPYWLGQEVVLIGDAALCGDYARALALQGVQTRVLEAKACSLAGLSTLVPQILR